VVTATRVGKPLRMGMPEAWWNEVATGVWRRFRRAAIAAGRRTKTSLARFDSRGRISWGNVIKHELAKGPIDGFAFLSDIELRALYLGDHDTPEPRAAGVPAAGGPGTPAKINMLANRYQNGIELFSDSDPAELGPHERPNVTTSSKREDHAQVA